MCKVFQFNNLLIACTKRHSLGPRSETINKSVVNPGLLLPNALGVFNKFMKTDGHIQDLIE